jgi:hypothetical protein
MFGILLAVMMPLIMVAVVRRFPDPPKVLQLMMAGYVVRMFLQFFVRDLPIFSYGAGGDCIFYEEIARIIAADWGRSGITYITSNEMVAVGSTSLPPNLFAMVFYVNGGDVTRMGATALVAAAACLSCHGVYRMAVECGGDEQKSFQVAAFLLFSPGFLFYTADLYKDGLVSFLVVTSLLSSFRLARKFSVPQLVVTILSLGALWFVRQYLIFLALAPLAIGLLGTGKGSFFRQFFVASVLGAGMLVIVSSSSVVQDISTRATSTFTQATSSEATQWNSLGGSGVTFDDQGSPLGSLGLKVLYTLFSPFPWVGGSVALQVGKLDALAWYYLFYRLLLAAKLLWQEDRSRLLMFLTFLVPSTLAYAMTMANVGLVLRQRIPIVMIGAALCCLSWPAARAPVPVVRAPLPLPLPGPRRRQA